jgi:pyrroloquinoline-quinone synthase
MRREILDSIIDARCLLKHPFYQAWNMGTLTQENIGLYAVQYGEFIDTIAAGWEAAGDAQTAEEEREHARLWTDFAAGLGVGATRPADKQLPEIEELVSLSGALFSKKATALGALYAFEQQQPGTAESKLAGLRKHYNVPAKAQVYFDIHKDDFEEPRWLAEQIDTLSPEEFEDSRQACSRMSAALWRGLDGVMSAIS